MQYGLIAERTLPDSRIAHVSPLAFGRARLSVGAAGSIIYQDQW